MAIGWHEKDPDFSAYRQIAQLCITAGADLVLIEEWTEVGCKRAAKQDRSVPISRAPASSIS